MKRTMRLLVVMMAGAMALAGLVSIDVAAQEAEGFPIGVVAAMCPEEYAGPFVGCEPWVGAEISVVSADGAVNETCITPDAAVEARVSSCGYDVPFGATITATLLSDIPDGWVLSSPVEQTVEIPDSPPDGIFGGPTFVLQPVGNTGEQPPASGDPTDVAEDTGITELPSTGRGPVVTVADTDLVTEQVVQTIMVLTAVMSLAFGSLALYARQKDL